MKSLPTFSAFMDTAMVMHEQQSRKINGGVLNLEYQIGEFSAMYTGILKTAANSLNRDVNDRYDAMSIWRTTYCMFAS
jgi:hypothetical protein